MRLKYIVLFFFIYVVDTISQNDIYQLQPWPEDSTYVLGAWPDGEPKWVKLVPDSIYISNDTIYLRDGSGYVVMTGGAGIPQNLIPVIIGGDTTGFFITQTLDTILFETDEFPITKIDTFDLFGTTLRLSIENDSIPFYGVDISSINTDNQNLSSTSSGTNRTINISGGTGTTISVADNDNDPTNELQNLSSTSSGTNRTINISGGTGTTISVADNDNDATNELQSLSYGTKSGTDVPLNITNGTGVTLRQGSNVTLTRDASNLMTISSTNTDNQNLSSTSSGTNRTINISGGTGTTISVADNDNDPTNELQNLTLSGNTLGITSGNSVTLPGGLSGSGVATRLAFWNGTSSLSSNANAYWDNVNNRLGVGTSSPSEAFQVIGDAKLGSVVNDFRKLYFGDGNFVWVGEDGADDRLALRGSTFSLNIFNGGGVGTSGQVLTSNGITQSWQTPSTGMTSFNLGINNGSYTTVGQGNNVTLNAGTNVTLSKSSNTITINASGGSDQSLSYGTKSGTDVPLNITNGTGVTLRQGSNVTLTRDASNLMTISSTNTDNQNLSSTSSGTNRTINISGGTGTTIDVADNDNSSTNELQNLSSTSSGTNRTINISSGTGTTIDVADNDNSSTNELQNLSSTSSGTNRTINISSGTGTTIDVADNDNDQTNEGFIGLRLVNGQQRLQGYNSSGTPIGNGVHIQGANGVIVAADFTNNPNGGLLQFSLSNPLPGIQNLSYGTKSGTDVPLNISDGTGVTLREGSNIVLTRNASNIVTISSTAQNTYGGLNNGSTGNLNTNNWTTVTSYGNALQSNMGTAPTNGEVIAVTSGGVYKIDWHCTCNFFSTSMGINLAIFINGSMENSTLMESWNASNTVASGLSGTFTKNLSINDVITLRSKLASSGTGNMSRCNLAVHKL